MKKIAAVMRGRGEGADARRQHFESPRRFANVMRCHKTWVRENKIHKSFTIRRSGFALSKWYVTLCR
jgi:hypothetical protein